jgi:hypothetical protein
MRTSWWAYIFVAVLTCAAAYPLFDGPALSTESARPSAQPERHAQPESHPLEQKPALAPIYKDGGPTHEERVEDIHAAPAVSEPHEPANVESARLDDAAGADTAERSEPNDTNTKQDLSYLAYYAYSEVLPDTKPADTILKSLEGMPPGTPVEEIERVSAALGLDFTFMKAVAKIESGFDPKQRTGSYIGLFQLSKKEFAMYGSGNILDARDNTVAAALKFMTESILFEIFTHKKPTMSDVYLIHQQGVDGAAEHVSHPHRLAWRSMCATDEGREKGEKWCKRAIWGNTLPAVKRIWKNVNNVTSGAFVAMWQQRMSQFYARYSQAAAN